MCLSPAQGPKFCLLPWSLACSRKPGLLLHRGAGRGRKAQKLESLVLWLGGMVDINPSCSGFAK